MWLGYNGWFWEAEELLIGFDGGSQHVSLPSLARTCAAIGRVEQPDTVVFTAERVLERVEQLRDAFTDTDGA